MRLRDKFRPTRKSLSVSSAFVCDNADAEGGVAERASMNADKALERLGDLLELLHDKGVLSDRDVIEFLGAYRWEEAE